MILPTSPNPPPIVPEPLIMGISPAIKLDQALVSRAWAIKTVSALPELFDRIRDIALSSDSDAASLDAIKYLVDRAGGKAVQVVENTGTIAHELYASDELKLRLSHLKNKTYDAVLTTTPGAS